MLEFIQRWRVAAKVRRRSLLRAEAAVQQEHLLAQPVLCVAGQVGNIARSRLLARMHELVREA